MYKFIQTACENCQVIYDFEHEFQQPKVELQSKISFTILTCFDLTGILKSKFSKK